MEIFESYRQAREEYVISGGNNFKASFDRILTNSTSDLEKIATFAAKSIEIDDYKSIQACYPFADLDMLERLHKERRIQDQAAALKALYHLFEDYLKPDGEQAYRLGPHLQTVMHFIFALDLQDKFDLTYLNRAIQKAREGGHDTVANNWQKTGDKIFAAQNRK